ncbi:MAG: Asp-tRNA(Asn)/Glu-tRNA(Gln) amidotransferase subunit GatA [Ruminococcus sp.]|nr:Asp-tRNA(Asn)/Glu-tRNA(Gln) amidotransferase subunit GatA [Ruminococcus sp.]
MGRIEQIHSLLCKKDISCRELTEEYLNAIQRDNPELFAYVTVTAQEALTAADKIDRQIAQGGDIGMLSGVPMSIKDNISTRGIRTTCCSKMLADYTPVYDASVWSKLKNSGAVLLGKANMDEFAMGSTGENSCFGASSNPYNTALVSGGSSGGSAVSVSANLAVYSLGTDTGGSVRQPASFCGVVGLKPTYGAVSRYGLVAFASSLDQIGPMASTVEDVSLVFDSIAGGDVLDSTCNRDYKPDTYKTLKDDIKGRTVGIIRQFADNNSISPEVKSSMNEAVKTFEDLGAKVIMVDIPEILRSVPVYCVISCAEASSNLARFDGIRYGYRAQGDFMSIHQLICKSRSEGFGKEVKRRIMMGTNVLSSDKCSFYYDKARALRQALSNEFSRAFSQCDVIIAPTAPTPAFVKNRVVADPTVLYMEDMCTVCTNLASLPAVSLPCGYSAQGLPIGMQIIGDKFSESLILNMAYKFQQATDFMRTSDWGVKL